MKHDYADQERETYETFAVLNEQNAVLPDISIVEFYMLAEGDQADWASCERALHAEGFGTQRDDDAETLIVATRKPVTLTAKNIWDIERRVTQIALLYDFYPDGWEFGFDPE